MGILSSLIGGIFGTAGSAMSAAMNYNYAKKLQEHQYDLNQNALRSFYANNRYSLENAGYNPLLGIAGSTAQGFSASSAGVPADISGGMSQGINTAETIKNNREQRELLQKQQENVSADTDVKKFGQKGAIIKNLLEFADKHKDNPKIQKVVDAQVLGVSPVNSAVSQINSFKNNHPTTVTVLRKLRQGDFRGAKYAIDLRRKRISGSLYANSAKAVGYGHDRGYDFEYLPDVEDVISRDYRSGKLKRR